MTIRWIFGMIAVLRVGLTASACIIVAVHPSLAQPERVGTDVVRARDVEGGTMTLDGQLSEPEWAVAETIPFVWNQPNALPGSGQKIEGTPVLPQPPDGNNGLLRILRDGNVVWMGLTVEDRSVGGGQSIWQFDGTIMTILDRSQRPAEFGTRVDHNYFANGVVNAEFFTTFWNPADTTDATTTYHDGSLVGSGRSIPGNGIRLFGDYGVGFGQGNVPRPPEDVAIWDAIVLVNGISNDDTHGDDVGYTIETYVDLGALGYDFSGVGGDKAAWSIALQDWDYSWPTDADSTFLSRVWFQNQWANNFNEGIGYIVGSSEVTVSSDPVPSVTEPEFTVHAVGSFGSPQIDGLLDDPIWGVTDTLFFLQYEQEPEGLARNVGVVPPYHMSYFRPNINGNLALVTDPSLGRVQMTHDGDFLYIALDAADQAISGLADEIGRDGLRITLRHVGELNPSTQTLTSRQFDFWVEGSGGVGYGLDAALVRNTMPDAVVAAVGLKGASTAADPSNVDEGYHIEIAIDLAATLGYDNPVGKGAFQNNGIWMSLTFFDGDFFQVSEDSYAMRSWMIGERESGASLYGWLGPAATDGLSIDLKVFLEGAYAGDGLDVPPEFTSSVPLGQPFSDPLFDGTMMDNDSPLTITSLPDEAVDWVQVALRTSTAAATEVPGGRKVGFLLSDGSIVDPNGLPLSFPGVAHGGYHAIVMHRNHLAVMSSDTLDSSDGTGSWDFTIAMAQAHTTGPAPMRDLIGGKSAMFAGDANIDGQITVGDFNAWLIDTKAGLTGYRQADFDLDGQVTANDFNRWLVNTKLGAASQVPD